MFIKMINHIEIHHCKRSDPSRFECRVGRGAKRKVLEEFATRLEAEAWATKTFDFVAPSVKCVRERKTFSRITNRWYE